MGVAVIIQYLDLPNDFNVVYYNDDFMLIDGFTREAIADSNGSSVTISTNGTDWNTITLSRGATANTLYFYYTRDKYKFNFAEGVYVDGNGNAYVQTKPKPGHCEPVHTLARQSVLLL